MIYGLLFHILAAVIWVGGMFFAHVMLRPAALALEPPVRLALWRRVLMRFFPWVWGAIATLLISGYGMVPILGGFAAIALYVNLMQGLGLIMMATFGHLYFAPWRRFRIAVDGGDWAAAAAQLAQIRAIVTFNLVLGLITMVIGATGRYWG
jgi:uncharacterized membrane protein